MVKLKNYRGEENIHLNSDSIIEEIPPDMVTEPPKEKFENW